eukprot:953094-Heterocapsa_arctica.AAC.1
MKPVNVRLKPTTSKRVKKRLTTIRLSKHVVTCRRHTEQYGIKTSAQLLFELQANFSSKYVALCKNV